jgi:hypothetical protein
MVSSLWKDDCNTDPPTAGASFTTLRESPKPKDPKDPKDPSKNIRFCHDLIHYAASVASSFSLFTLDDASNSVSPFCVVDANENCITIWDNSPHIMPAATDLRLRGLPFISNIQFVARTVSNLPPYPKDVNNNPIDPVIEITDASTNNVITVFTFSQTDWKPNHDIVITPVYSCVDFEEASGQSNRMKTDHTINRERVSEISTENTLIIMPNPAKDYVDIVLNSGTESITSIKIVDGMGKEIFQRSLPGDRSYLYDLNQTTPGHYIIIVNSKQNLYVKKLMVIK